MAQPVAAKDADPQVLDRTYLRFLLSNQATLNFFDCLIAKQPDAARRLFARGLTAEERQQLSQQYWSDRGAGCLLGANYGTIGINADGFMASALTAERLIALDHVPLPAMSAVRTQVAGGGSFSWTWQYLTQGTDRLSLPIAYCLPDRHPADVAMLLQTKPVSEAERRQFNAMAPSISSCIPAGQVRLLQPIILRAAIAYAYYLSARAAEPG